MPKRMTGARRRRAGRGDSPADGSLLRYAARTKMANMHWEFYNIKPVGPFKFYPGRIHLILITTMIYTTGAYEASSGYLVPSGSDLALWLYRCDPPSYKKPLPVAPPLVYATRHTVWFSCGYAQAYDSLLAWSLRDITRVSLWRRKVSGEAINIPDRW